MFQFDLSAAKKGSMDLFFGMSFTPGSYRAGGEEAARAMFAPAVQASVTDLVL